MSAQVWERARRSQVRQLQAGWERPDVVVPGPWPSVEEVHDEFERAVVIDRRALWAGRPVPRSARLRGLGWDVAVMSVLAMMALGVLVAVVQLVGVALGGHVGAGVDPSGGAALDPAVIQAQELPPSR